MLMLVNCPNCRTQLQLPAGARSIRCDICQAIIRRPDPTIQPPAPSPAQPPHPTSSNNHRYARPQPYPPPAGPSPYNPFSSFGQTPPVNGRKRAVICGILYRGMKGELKGCINDAKCMKYLLISKFKFPESSILMLTEEETDPNRIPTKHNIITAMQWLVQDCQPGDSLVFHFSGHGRQQRNNTGDEIDGYDETLCPLDYETQGVIVDDDINATMVKPLPHGVKLHAIIDACHSGTMLDLPFLYRINNMIVPVNIRTVGKIMKRLIKRGRFAWEDHRPRWGRFKRTNGGEVICFSGCDDGQSSADTTSLSKRTSTGAMTFSFIQAIEKGHVTTYGHILDSMRTTIRNNEDARGGGFRQDPQLTSNKRFDVYKKQFSL